MAVQRVYRPARQAAVRRQRGSPCLVGARAPQLCRRRRPRAGQHPQRRQELRRAHLPGGMAAHADAAAAHPSAEAAALRQHGAVAAAVAAAHPEEEQGAVVGWVEEAVEAGCSVLPGLVRRGLLSQEEAAAVVAALAALPVPAAFVAYASRGAGRKRAAPETYAATVLHLRLPRIAGGKAAVAFGRSKDTVNSGLNPNVGGGLAWVRAAVAAAQATGGRAAAAGGLSWRHEQGAPSRTIQSPQSTSISLPFHSSNAVLNTLR